MTTIVVISVSDRIDRLNNLLACIANRSDLDDFKVALHFQDNEGNRHLIRHKDRIDTLLVSPNRLGCHGARIALLRRIADDTYVNVDDDVTLTEHTRWAPAIERARMPGVGFVLTNWAANLPAYLKKISNISDRFVKQVMVYNGGGMAYTDPVADLIRDLPVKPARFDDLWPLTAYVNGYLNYRYLGSLALHTIAVRGGMRAYLDDLGDAAPPLAGAYVTYRMYKRPKPGWDLHIPADSDIRPETHLAHKAARIRLLERIAS